MGKVLAIDLGKKRCGLAYTDDSKIIAYPLETVDPKNLMSYLKNYIEKEDVETIVVGHPRNLDTSDTHITRDAIDLVKKLKIELKEIEIVLHDERFTSKMAMDSLIQTGASKKLRKNKSLLDEISAVIILRSYLASKDQE